MTKNNGGYRRTRYKSDQEVCELVFDTVPVSTIRHAYVYYVRYGRRLFGTDATGRPILLPDHKQKYEEVSRVRDLHVWCKVWRPTAHSDFYFQRGYGNGHGYELPRKLDGVQTIEEAMNVAQALFQMEGPEYVERPTNG